MGGGPRFFFNIIKETLFYIFCDGGSKVVSKLIRLLMQHDRWRNESNLTPTFHVHPRVN